MFQLIGSLLAFFAIVSALAGAPIAGAALALATFLWVVIAKPSQRTNLAKVGAPWGAAYAVASR
jgi:hypothetical protein